MHGNSLVVQWSRLCPKILKAMEHSQKNKKHYMQKEKALSHSVVYDSLRPHGL